MAGGRDRGGGGARRNPQGTPAAGANQPTQPLPDATVVAPRPVEPARPTAAGGRGGGSSRKPRSAFWLEVRRSIRGSLGRFLAVMGIAALGCGFFAGLQMCGPDMRIGADRFYDGANLWDLRVVSTMGLSEEGAEGIAATPGVEADMPSRTVDAMAQMGTQRVAVRIGQLDADAAAASTVGAGGTSVASDDPAYLNRPILRSGRFPQAADECVISADVSEPSVDLGQTVTVLYGTDALDQELDQRTFTVVGMVTSADYPYTGSFGSTNLGSGMVDQYLYVPESAFKEDAPYTEVYLTVEGAAGEASESDAYFDVVDQVGDALTWRADDLAAQRQEEVRATAQEKLDSKRADYEREKADALSQLDDAKAQLDAAKAQIDDGAAQLAAGERDWRSGLASYQGQKTQADSKLADAQAQIDSKRSELADKEAQWQEGAAALLAQTGTSSVADARASLASQRSQAQTGLGQLDAGIAQLAQVQDLYDKRDQLTAQRDDLAGKVAQLEQGIAAAQVAGQDTADLKAQLTKAQAGLQQAEAGLSQVEAGISRAGMTAEEAAAKREALQAQGKDLTARVSQLDQAIAQADQLSSARIQLDQGSSQLDAAQSALDAQRAQAASKLAAAKAKLDQARRTLAASRTQLAEARRSYQEGLATYEANRADAESRFADAEAQLADAQAQVDEVARPDVYVLDRSESEGAAAYHADTQRMDRLAAVFPTIFFLVAALVSLTTMTRTVEDDRQQIGTYKALGYSTAKIAQKYLIYAGLAAGVGAVAGILVLSQVLPAIVTYAYAIIYTVPLLRFPIPVDLPKALLAALIGVGVTLGATWAAVVSTLRETPAALMLPRAPKPGKRIWLERIAPLWSRLSFSWKVTFRNLFRYKRRLVMTVVGISGCTALLLVGFGLHDSIWDIIDGQFGPIVHYNTTVGMDAVASEDDVATTCSYLAGQEGTGALIRVQEDMGQAQGPGGTAEGKTRVTVVVPREAGDLAKAVSLRQRLGKEPVAFDDQAVVVSEKLATLQGLEVGSTLTVYDQDDVGNPTGPGHALTVTGICENYVGNYVYVGRQAWAQAGGEEEPAFSTILVSLTSDADVRAAIADALHERSHVSTVVFTDETITMYRNALSSVNLVVVVLTVSAAALALIVLYNLTSINVAERVREIASLKVLGFTRREVHAYVFREVALLAFLGDILGMFLGMWLEHFVVVTAEVDYVMFGRAIHPASFAISFALTLAFTALALLAMRGKLDRVDMVESLKSVD